MKGAPILTAIIFTYNHVKYIEKCIESIVNQETDYNYKIHIWDDCSIDGTTEICQDYAMKHPDKIELVAQEKNTFLEPYLKMQSYSAIKKISTKYFCIIDGDDYWCDCNKVQIALDFLENNDSYIGFAHDTLQVEQFTQKRLSYVHEVLKWDVKTHVEFSVDAPFFLTSSRIFRNVNYYKEKVLPIDYLLYYYHLSKGAIYYYDKIMASYVIGENSTFATLQNIKDLCGMFAYKASLLFNFSQDEFCTELQKKYDIKNGVGDFRYRQLCLFKKHFGIKLGWKIWFFVFFVRKYGFECMNVNYVYSRKIAKKKSDIRCDKNAPKSLRGKYIEEVNKEKHILQEIKKQERRIKRLKYVYVFKKILGKRLEKMLKISFKRKYRRIYFFKKELKSIVKDEKC